MASFLTERDIRLLLARMKDPVLSVLGRTAIAALPPVVLTSWSVDDAVKAASAEANQQVD